MSRMSSLALLILCLIGSALSAPKDPELDVQNLESNEIDQSGNWERMARMFGSCIADKEEMFDCFAVKGITALNRAARMQNVELFSGIKFERDPSVSIRDGKSLDSENEIESSLPAESTKRTARLIDLLWNAAVNFMETHKLQVKVNPEEITAAARTFNEARGKIKKFLGPILLGVGLKVLAFLAIFGGGLALLVTKALIVAKLAFVIASVLGLQKLLGSGSSLIGSSPSKNTGWPSNGGWSSGGTTGWSNSGATSGYPYARAIQVDAQDMAYNGQKP